MPCRLARPLVVPLLVAASLQAQQPATAFVNVAVIPMDRERVLVGQTVLVQGERIAAMGPVGRVPIPAGAVRVDGRGKFLLPGLADMHVHLAARPSNYGTVAPNVADAFMTFVANGVITVREMHSGGRASEAPAVRQKVQAGELFGPRIYTAGGSRHLRA